MVLEYADEHAIAHLYAPNALFSSRWAIVIDGFCCFVVGVAVVVDGDVFVVVIVLVVIVAFVVVVCVLSLFVARLICCALLPLFVHARCSWLLFSI